MRKIYFLRFIPILGISILLAWNQGCKNKGTTDSNTGNQKVEKNEIDSLPIDTQKILLKLKKYNISDSLLSDQKFKSDIIKQFGAINQAASDDLSHSVGDNNEFQFVLGYQNPNSTLSFIPLKVKWNDLKEYIQYDDIKNSLSEGLGIYYVINNSGSRKKLTYVLARAALANVDGKDTIQPSPNPSNNKYLMLDDNTNLFTPISPSDFSRYLEQYKSTVVFKQDGSSYLVRDWTHPLVCFHVGDTVRLFFEDNLGLIPSTDPGLLNLFVVVHNAAMAPYKVTNKAGDEMEICAQSPFVFFQYGTTEFYDNIDVPGFKFRNKAMDVGRLCPPQCK